MLLKVILAISFSKNFHVMMYYKRRREISREKDYFDTFLRMEQKLKNCTINRGHNLSLIIKMCR